MRGPPVTSAESLGYLPPVVVTAASRAPLTGHAGALACLTAYSAVPGDYASALGGESILLGWASEAARLGGTEPAGWLAGAESSIRDAFRPLHVAGSVLQPWRTSPGTTTRWCDKEGASSASPAPATDPRPPANPRNHSD